MAFVWRDKHAGKGTLVNDSQEGFRAMLTAIPGLLKSDRFSDLTLRLEDGEDGEARTWKAHKFVLCSQSKFFASACDGPWKEAQEGVITLHDDEPSAIDAMLAFLHTGTYHPPKDSDVASRCILNLWIFEIADKYELSELAEIAKSRFSRNTNATDLWMAPRFPEVIEELYMNCPDNALAQEMRKLMVNICITNEQALLHGSEFVGFREVVKDVHLFAIEFQKQCIDRATRDSSALLFKRRMELIRFEHAKVRPGEARIQCDKSRCMKTFVAEIPADKRHCPYCVTGTVRLATHTIGDDLPTLKDLREESLEYRKYSSEANWGT